jgi:hypothetical protein
MQIADTVQLIIKSVLEGKGTVGQLIMRDTLMQLVNGIARDVRTTMRGVNGSLHNVDSLLTTFNVLGKGGAGVVDSLNTVLVQVTTLLTNLSAVSSNVNTMMLQGSTQQLPADVQKVLKTLDKDLDETQILLRALQEHWLLRGSVKKVKNADAQRPGNQKK